MGRAAVLEKAVIDTLEPVPERALVKGRAALRTLLLDRDPEWACQRHPDLPAGWVVRVGYQWRERHDDRLPHDVQRRVEDLKGELRRVVRLGFMQPVLDRQMSPKRGRQLFGHEGV